MASRWDQWFYNSAAWKDVRQAYFAKARGLCERCGAPGDIVHHKVYLTPTNISDKRIAYGYRNLELLCLACHNAEHGNAQVTETGLMFDDYGELIEIIPPGGSFKK